MVLTALIVIGGVIAGILLKILPLTIFFGIFGLIWVIFAVILFTCWKQQLDDSIVLLSITGNFLRTNP